ncbi:MAG: hypothetical protein SFY80_09500 [Verrucomicrobiota bacterium]|nr:hypothetical protein [Verrucomicrobiota bacterium]
MLGITRGLYIIALGILTGCSSLPTAQSTGHDAVNAAVILAEWPVVETAVVQMPSMDSARTAIQGLSGRTREGVSASVFSQWQAGADSLIVAWSGGRTEQRWQPHYPHYSTSLEDHDALFLLRTQAMPEMVLESESGQWKAEAEILYANITAVEVRHREGSAVLIDSRDGGCLLILTDSLDEALLLRNGLMQLAGLRQK